MEKIEQNQSRYFDLAIEILILIVVFLVPTVYDRRIGIVFSGTKLAVIRMLMLLILSVWSCKVLIFREHKFVRAVLDWPVVSYALALTVATITSVHFLVSFMGFYGRYEGLSTWWVYALLYFVTVNFIRTKEQIRRIFVAVLMAGTMMSIYGIIQRIGKDPYAWGGVVTWERVIATIGQPNFLAAYVVMAFFMGLSLLIMDDDGTKASEASSIPEPNRYKREKAKASKPLKNDFLDRIVSQAMIVAPFFGVIAAYLIMIYQVNTTNFPLLVISWTVITGLALVFIFVSRDIDKRALDCILFLSLPTIYTCMFFTQSRGGLLAFFGAGALFIVLADRKALLSHWRELGILAAIITVIMGVTIINPQYSPFQRFSAEVNVEGETDAASNMPTLPGEKSMGLEIKGAAGSRIETWTSGIRIVADHPVFGIGPEVLKMIFPRYETELFRFKEAFHVKQDRCHNEVCDIAVTKGIASLFIYVWLLFLFYREGLRKLSGDHDGGYKIFVVGILAATTSYLIQNQFSFGVIAITSIVWVMFGLISIPEIKKDEELALPAWKGIDPSEVPWLLISFIVVLFLSLSWASSIQFRADKYYKSGKNYVDGGQFQNSLPDFKRSLGISPFEGGTMTYYGITLLNVAQSNPGNKALYDEAINAMLRATVADPYNADNFYILGKTYLALQSFGVPGALDKAFECTDKAIAIDPYYAEAYYNRGLCYEMKGQLEKAVEDYKVSFMINPSLTMSMQRLGLVYSNMGQPGRIVETFNEALDKYRNNVSLLENLGIAYSVSKNDAGAVKAFARVVEIDPKNVRVMVSLAQSYMRIGNLSSAESVLQQAMMVEPANIDVHNNLGTLYMRKGPRERAIEEFKQVLILDPTNPYATNMLQSMGVK